MPLNRRTKTVDAMIARVYLFIKEEYKFMKMYNVDNCILSPLLSCTERAAKATGVCLNYVKHAVGRTKAQQQKKQLNTAKYPPLRTYKPAKKRRQDDRNIITDNKTIKLNINIDYKDSHTKMAGSHTSNSTIIDISDKVDNATDINREAGYPRTSTWTEKEEHEMLTGVCSETDINQKMGLSNTFTEQEHEMLPVCRNLRESLQFEDEIKEEITETFYINNSTYSTQEIDLPSACIKQEEYEMLPINREAGYPKTSTWTEKEEHEMVTGVCSVTDINQKMGLSNTFTEHEHEMPPVCRNLRESLQFEDEIKEEITETLNINNSTYNTQEIDLPSTRIKQEEYEMLPLSNIYTENDEDEGLYLSPNQRHILQFEDEVTVNSVQGNVDTETFIIQEVEFPSPSIKQEENEITSLYKTYTIHEQGVVNSRHLNQILQVDAEHLTSTKKGENDSLPSDKFATNLIGVVKFEEEKEIEAVSYMGQNCYKIEPKLEKVDVSESSVSEQFIFYENLPSSSGNNNDIIAKANETEDIEFVCIKNEFHSDSSQE